MDTPLVSTRWLANHLAEDNLRVVDIRGKVLPASQPPPHYFSHQADYGESHIPSAVFVDWMVDIVEPGSPASDVASPDRFASLMGQLGIDGDTRVVIYDDADSMFAARLWWALRYYGHKNVSVLNGGWKKWIAEGLPTDNQIPNIDSKVFVPRINESLRANADYILPEMESSHLQLIDVRSPAEYSGQASRAQLMGHIPSAINLPRKTMVANDSTLLEKDALTTHFTNLNISLNAPNTVIYCNSGVSASYGMLAMLVAGAENVRVYDGSWKEWGNDTSKPIAKSE